MTIFGNFLEINLSPLSLETNGDIIPLSLLQLLAQALKLRALEGKTSNVIDSIPPLMINVNVTQEDTEQAQQTQPVAPTAPAEPFVGLPFIASTAQNEANFDRCITEGMGPFLSSSMSNKNIVPLSQFGSGVLHLSRFYHHN